jgi:hypothetical protein
VLERLTFECALLCSRLLGRVPSAARAGAFGGAAGQEQKPGRIRRPPKNIPNPREPIDIAVTT